MTRTERLLRLMNRIRETRSFTAQSMAAEFGVSYRTILRDLQELSLLGLPLYAEPGRGGGYRLLGGARSERSLQERPETPSPFRVACRPAVRLAGLECQAPFTAFYLTQTVLPRLWKQLEHDLQASPFFSASSGRRVGAALGRSRTYRYIAGLEIRPSQPVPDSWTRLSLPAREYAVYVHEGPAGRDETDQTYFCIADRLRRCGLDPDPEGYTLEAFDAGSPETREIWVPLR